MNNRQMEIQKDLAEVRAQIKDTDKYKNELLNREASLKRELETIYAMNTPMIIEGHDLLDKYRRLRILYNRVGIFGTKIFYSYWFEHVFQTKRGLRKFVCSLPYMDTEDEIMDFYYIDENGHTLFEIQINKNRYNFKGYLMNEGQAWLAIHELEELSYKELEVFNEN